jgi:hypothetical protein
MVVDIEGAGHMLGMTDATRPPHFRMSALPPKADIGEGRCHAR